MPQHAVPDAVRAVQDAVGAVEPVDADVVEERTGRRQFGVGAHRGAGEQFAGDSSRVRCRTITRCVCTRSNASCVGAYRRCRARIASAPGRAMTATWGLSARFPPYGPS